MLGMLPNRMYKRNRDQKIFYDKQCKEVELKEGDMVMLKTQTSFCSDRKYKGPLIIKSVTPMNVIIQLKGDSTAEELCISHRVSLCNTEMSHSTPWIRHTRKMRKRCKSKKRTVNKNAVTDNPVTETTAVSSGTRISSRGHQIRTPGRFLVVDSQGHPRKEGEVLRSDDYHVRNGDKKGRSREKGGLIPQTHTLELAPSFSIINPLAIC